MKPRRRRKVIDCPYKQYGCTFQATNDYDMEDHVNYMASIDNDEHPSRPEERKRNA